MVTLVRLPVGVTGPGVVARAPGAGVPVLLFGVGRVAAADVGFFVVVADSVLLVGLLATFDA